MACLTYLSFDVFAEGFCLDDGMLECRLRQYPLRDYAARNWGHHVRISAEQAIDLALEFLTDDYKVAGAGQVLLVPNYRYSNYSQSIPKLSGIHLAAYFGLTDAMLKLIEKGADIELKDSSGAMPLHWAARGGHKAVVFLLLEKGANIDAESSSGWTALHLAAWFGSDAVIRLLLAQNADIKAKASSGPTTLYWAAYDGLKTVVRLLADNTEVTALHWAAMRGYEGIVQLLLEKGAEIEARDSVGRTALDWAVGNGHERVERLLLKMGARSLKDLD
jgi:ankyrin repeat protein